MRPAAGPAGFRAGPLREIARTPWFWAVLALKLVLGATCASYVLRELFVPFVGYFVASGFQDPWRYFGDLGRWTMFPYPPAMLYALALPRALIAPFVGDPPGAATTAHLLAARLPMLAADLAVLGLLARWFPGSVRQVLAYYWCSPILIYACYWHGQLDVLPTAVFVGALALLRAGHLGPAAGAFGLALATKSHLFAAAPFLLVYLRHDRGLPATARFAAIAAATYALIVAPYAMDPAFRRMVFGTEEQARLFAFQLPVGLGSSLLLAPGAIAVLWFLFAAHAKRNWDLLMLYMALLFGVFTLLTPPAPGYFLWSLPFLVYLMCLRPRVDGTAYAAYTLGYLAFFLVAQPAGPDDVLRGLLPPAWTAALAPAPAVRDALFTLMQAAFAAVLLHVSREAIRSNAVYRARTRPILIGVGGDSGAGKDTLAGMIEALFPPGKTVAIAGDDYHRWERGDENWKVYTHLDVRANDVHRQYEHAVALVNGETIHKVRYDHATGRFTDVAAVAPNEVVIFQGLHTLSLEGLRTLYDLKVYLDPEEALRVRWKLRRDVEERGHPAAKVLGALADREPDRLKYIVPQRDHADLVVRWRADAGAPATGEGPEDAPAPLALEVLALNTFELADVVAELRRAGAEVDHEPYADTRWQHVVVRGRAPGAALGAAAAAVIPNLEELAPDPAFHDDLAGCLQVLLLACLSARLRLAGARPAP